VLLGVVGVLVLPAAIAYSRVSSTFSLLDAAWLIPVAALASVASLLAVRRASRRLTLTLATPRSVRVARVLAVAGISMTLAATIAVGFYEVLVRLEG
jgi:hypothetical protein